MIGMIDIRYDMDYGMDFGMIGMKSVSYTHLTLPTKA